MVENHIHHHPVASVSKNEETNSYTLKFSKFMAPDTVTADTVQIEGLTDVSIEPVYLSEGDEYADTFTVKGEKLESYKADVDDMGDFAPDTEVIADGYFHESEYRAAPYFDMFIDGITNLDA